MLQIIHIAAFWFAVVVAIRVAVCFPNSLFARVLFSRHGPLRGRSEPEADFLLRSARFWGGWLIQAASVFAVGCVALSWEPSLAESSYFLVLWAVVVPLLGCGALVAALVAAGHSVWLRRLARMRTDSSSAHGLEA